MLRFVRIKVHGVAAFDLGEGNDLKKDVLIDLARILDIVGNEYRL